MISTAALSILIYIALAVTVITPVLFLVLLIRDYKRGKLW